MMITGSNAIGMIKGQGPEVAVNMGSFILPMGTRVCSATNFGGYVIFSNSEYKEETMAYLQFTFLPENIIKFAEGTGRMPTQKTVMSDSVFEETILEGFVEMLDVSKVIYDRSGSSISLAQRGEFDWKEIFMDADWFHFTGITQALGGECADICLDACKAAKEQGVTVSCDLNYRNKLWDKKKANRIMTALMPYVNVCIANEEDAADVFGIKADETAFFSPKYSIHIVDRVGGGDSFCGAFIHGMLSQMGEQETINFAAAVSCLKHTIEHDFNLVSKEEVNSLMNGNGSGRVQR